MNGIATKKIMIVPCVLKSCAKWSGVRNPPPSPNACWVRISAPSMMPRAIITSDSTTYMMPMRL